MFLFVSFPSYEVFVQTSSGVVRSGCKARFRRVPEGLDAAGSTGWLLVATVGDAARVLLFVFGSSKL